MGNTLRQNRRVVIGTCLFGVLCYSLRLNLILIFFMEVDDGDESRNDEGEPVDTEVERLAGAVLSDDKVVRAAVADLVRSATGKGAVNMDTEVGVGARVIDLPVDCSVSRLVRVASENATAREGGFEDDGVEDFLRANLSPAVLFEKFGLGRRIYDRNLMEHFLGVFEKFAGANSVDSEFFKELEDDLARILILFRDFQDYRNALQAYLDFAFGIEVYGEEMKADPNFARGQREKFIVCANKLYDAACRLFRFAEIAMKKLVEGEKPDNVVKFRTEGRPGYFVGEC